LSDTVFIRDLRFKTIIGCWDWERQVPQDIIVNLEIEWDCAAVGALDAAVNYAAVAEAVIGCVQQGRFELVETAAEAVAALVLEEFSAPAVRVTIAKPRAVREAGAVGVSIERRAAA